MDEDENVIDETEYVKSKKYRSLPIHKRKDWHRVKKIVTKEASNQKILRDVVIVHDTSIEPIV